MLSSVKLSNAVCATRLLTNDCFVLYSVKLTAYITYFLHNVTSALFPLSEPVSGFVDDVMFSILWALASTVARRDATAAASLQCRVLLTPLLRDLGCILTPGLDESTPSCRGCRDGVCDVVRMRPAVCRTQGRPGAVRPPGVLLPGGAARPLAAVRRRRAPRRGGRRPRSRDLLSAGQQLHLQEQALAQGPVQDAVRLRQRMVRISN